MRDPLYKGSTSQAEVKYAAVRKHVEDEDFWARVEEVVVLTEPFSEAIHMLEGDSVNCADAYFSVKVLDGHVKDINRQADDTDRKLPAAVYQKIVEGWESRRQDFFHDVYPLAALLDPRYQDKWTKVGYEDFKAALRCMGEIVGPEKKADMTTTVRGFIRDPALELKTGDVLAVCSVSSVCSVLYISCALYMTIVRIVCVLW